METMRNEDNSVTENRTQNRGRKEEKREDEAYVQRRRELIRMKKERRRKQLIRRYMIAGAGGMVLIIITVGLIFQAGNKKKKQEIPQKNQVETEIYKETEPLEEGGRLETETEQIPISSQDTSESLPVKSYQAQITEETQPMNGEVFSNYGIFIDLETGKVLAERNASDVINPASMTKILTVLTAAELIPEERLDEKIAVSKEATEYSFVNDCSNAGFETGEEVTIRDLFYGTILPSGGEAAVELAMTAAGSLDAFVDKMNEKAEELGISDTAHFTNCAGLYDKNHHCTVYDMAMILEAALDNPFCREVISARTYQTTATKEHPEGMLLSNWFLRRIEDKDTGGSVLGAKTGYVAQSGNCAASYGTDKKGRTYICVTADATSSWRCIYDHVALYKQFSEN